MLMIYSPAEDSFLICEVISKLKNLDCKKILEMGSGSGIIAETLLSNKISEKNLTLVDINLEAIKILKQKFPKSRIIKSNLFEKVKGKFDFLVFNPPYLPEEKLEDKDSKIATTGGKFGSEIINEFLKQSKKHLNKKGKIILLTSSLTKKINWQNFRKKKLASKKLFFEELGVWELNLI